ncbi:MAG: YggT family protein [Lachnospirales bacterium]
MNEIIIIVIKAISIFVRIFNIAILARCIISWFPISRDNPLCNILYAFTEPIMGPIRDIINKSPIGNSMLDFSPIFAIIIVQLLGNMVIRLLFTIVM